MQSVNQHEQYIHRCLQLAAAGAGNTAPNPMVGAVLVYQDRIIGEGYHEKNGGPHAEVNCLNSVAAENKSLIPESTIYVSLEPCAHFGKTPPCADLIIKNNIRKVVIGVRDPFPEVDGKGIEKLQRAGIEITTGILEREAREINRRFFRFHQSKRPYIILKWAQTADRIIGDTNKRLMISGQATNLLVHRWRAEEAAILVGANTALRDDPLLTTRLWPGKNPVRIVLDPQCRLPLDLRVFNGESETVIFNNSRSDKNFHGEWIMLSDTADFISELCDNLYLRNIQSVLIEGGADTLNRFIAAGTWDEARTITATKTFAGSGISAPVQAGFLHIHQEILGDDQIDYFEPGGNHAI